MELILAIFIVFIAILLPATYIYNYIIDKYKLSSRWRFLWPLIMLLWMIIIHTLFTFSKIKQQMTTTIEVPRGENIGKAIQQAVPAHKSCEIKFLDVYRDVKRKCNVAKIMIL